MKRFVSSNHRHIRGFLILLAVLLLVLGMGGSAMAYSRMVLPDSLREIREEAFAGNRSVEWVVVPEGVTRIESRAFADCPALWRVEIPGSVQYIAEDAFEGSGIISLTTVKGSYGDTFAAQQAFLTYVPGEKYAGEAGRYATYHFENGVLTISGEGELYKHTTYAPVPWYYFRNQVREIVIKDGITDIRSQTFADCRNLETVTIPRSVESIHNSAFMGAPCGLVVCAAEGSVAGEFARKKGYTTHNMVDIVSEPPSMLKLFDEELFTLEVNATGDGLTYQWQVLYNGKWLDERDSSYGESGTWGSKTASLSCNTMTYSEEGWVYRCMVTDCYGNVAYTGGTTLSFRKNVEIIEFPASQRCRLGDTAEFTVVAEGDGLSYQWYYRNGLFGELRACADGNSPMLRVVFEGDYDLNYLCVVTDAYGNSERTFMCNIYEEISLTDPADATVQNGRYASFSIEATGSDLSYLWQYRVPGDSRWWTWSASSTQKTLIFRAGSSHNGWEFRCRVKDADGVIQYTEPAVLTVLTPVTGVTLSSGAITLNVNQSKPVTEWSRLDLSSGPINITDLHKTYLTAAVQPQNANDTSLVWSSSDPRIVSIVYDDVGNAVSLQAGTREGVATVSVISADGECSASCEVTVRNTLAFESLSIDCRDRVCGQPIACEFNFSGGLAPYDGDIYVYREYGSGVPELVYTSHFSQHSCRPSFTPDRPGTYFFMATLVDATGKEVSGRSGVVFVTRPVSAVTLDKHSLTLNVGDSAFLFAAVSPGDASNPAVEWLADDSVASCTDGYVLALSPGTAAITVRSVENPAIYDSCTVNVRKPLERLELDREELTLVIGQTYHLTPSFYPADATDAVISRWTETDYAVASVSNGTVTAHAAGTSVITAHTPEGISASCTVHVISPITGISLNKTVYQTYTDVTDHKLTAAVYPAGATGKVVWSSSDSLVAKVAQDGSFTVGKSGKAVITASTEDGAFSASCTVNVAIPPKAHLTASATELLAGDNTPFRVYFSNGYKPYKYSLTIYDRSDMSVYSSYDWEDIYYNEREIHVNFPDGGDYAIYLDLTDGYGRTSRMGVPMHVQGHVSFDEVIQFSDRYYTGRDYKFMVVPEGGLEPYGVKMSLFRTDAPYDPIYSTFAEENGSGGFTESFPLERSGSYFVRASAWDTLGETYTMDSEPFTVEDIPVHTVQLDVREVELRPGESFRVEVNVYPKDATDQMVEISYFENVSILNCYMTERQNVCEFVAREPGECYVIFSSRSNPEEYATIHVTVFPNEQPDRITIINRYEPTPEDIEKLDRITIEYEEREQEREDLGQEEETKEVIFNQGTLNHMNGYKEIEITPNDAFPEVNHILGFVYAGYRFTCYPVGDSSIIPYTGKDLATRGDTNGPRASASIYATDELQLRSLGCTNGVNWALVTYPTGSGTRDAFINLWDIINGKETENHEAGTYITLTGKRGGGGASVSVSPGQYMYLLYRDASNCQVMVERPDGSFFIGWCTTAEYEYTYDGGSSNNNQNGRDEFPKVNDELGFVHAGYKFTCYPVNNTSIIPYTGKDLRTRGDTNGPREGASISAGDRLTLIDLGQTNGVNWAKVSYPTSSGNKIAYVNLWDIIGGSANENKEVEKPYVLARNRALVGSAGYVRKGQFVYLLYKDSEKCQVLAYQDDGSYVIGWCTRDEYDGNIAEFDPVWPCNATYRISALYNYSRTGKFGGAKHSCRFETGIDIAGEYGEPVLAVEDGWVYYVPDVLEKGFGNNIRLEHENGMVSLYAHLSEIRLDIYNEVKNGNRVYVHKGEEIGKVGDSGGVETHLHFELAVKDVGGAKGDPWLTFFREKYKSLIVYDSECYKAGTSANPEEVNEWIRQNGILG